MTENANSYLPHYVIAQGCGQTLGLGLVDSNRTVGNY